MTIEQSEKLNGLKEVGSIQRFVEPVLTFYNQEIFPHNRSFNWTNDLFGPVIVPSKGWTIKLEKDTYPLYERIIEVYEKNDVRINQDRFYINGELSDTYTFRMDYYFAIGDNRHNSADSRHWGFIPEDHLLGKAVAIWWSHDPSKSFIEGIRKDRIFKRIK
jgi:signal peptidase I